MLDEIYKKLSPEEQKYLQDIITHLQERADRDDLTGLYNKGFFGPRIEAEVHRVAKATHDPDKKLASCVSLLFVDIDDFKKFQDTHSKGHEAGNIVLRQVAQTLVDGVRDYDVVCRYGGEEMAIICPDQPLAEAHKTGEGIRQMVEGLCQVTVSIGVSSFPHPASSLADLIHQADRAMYRAKNDGKNRCYAFEESVE